MGTKLSEMNKYTKDKKETIKIRLSSELRKKYFDFCIKNNFSLSERIRMLIENDINDGK